MANSPHVNAAGVTLPSGYQIDCQSFSIREAQATEDVTPFGSNVYSKTIGSGTPNISGSLSGFAISGVTTTTGPGFKIAALGNGDTGIGTASFHIADGTSGSDITIVGLIVVNDISLSVSRIRAGVPVSLSWVGAGDFTTTWA